MSCEKENRSREMYSPIRSDTRKHKLSTEIFPVQVQEDTQIIVKEEGRKEEDRQERDDVKF